MERTELRDLANSIVPDVSAEELMLAGLQALIASEITIKRQELGLTQADLARQLGVSQGLVSRWESGDANFTVKTLVEIAAKLGIEMQSPFKLSPAKAQYFNNGRVVYWIPQDAYHSSGRYLSPNSYTSVSDGEELEEM